MNIFSLNSTGITPGICQGLFPSSGFPTGNIEKASIALLRPFETEHMFEYLRREDPRIFYYSDTRLMPEKPESEILSEGSCLLSVSLADCLPATEWGDRSLPLMISGECVLYLCKPAFSWFKFIKESSRAAGISVEGPYIASPGDKGWPEEPPFTPDEELCNPTLVSDPLAEPSEPQDVPSPGPDKA